ncbi:MAG: alpha-rhamnosidase [Clostridia bacterium]|nr:alpha-rhamnosidase [Clostridia bacterium]
MNSKWIWYYGDFEMYHSQKLHLRRKERNVVFPAIWYVPGVYSGVRFRKKVKIDREEDICVTANGVGFVQIGAVKYEFGKKITLHKGEYFVTINVSNMTGLPCAYVEGDTVKSNEEWTADYYNGKWKKVGCSSSYTDKNVVPDTFIFKYKKILPLEKTVQKGGVLYDFGKETFARIVFKKLSKNITVFFGESEYEALDTKNNCQYEAFGVEDIDKNFEAKAFRYIYIPDIGENEVDFDAYYEYLPVEKKGAFESSDDMLNKIWNVSADTLELNSREFFLDGIKRDRWVWSGDSYQSYFVNRYLFFDEDIVRRTIIALGGKGEVEQHINTILDYSFYWIMSIYDYYEMTGDMEFVADIFPRMKAVMDFCLSRLDKNGFASKMDAGDWIFIDWADIDKTGAVCAEQMLFLRSLEVFIKCADMLGIENSDYLFKRDDLEKKINEYYWSDEKGAFIDSFESGKNNVTRHANIFALLFGYAEGEKREAIIKNVILNDDVAQITTPYFKFYELDAMCSIGQIEYAINEVEDYWGGMIKAGATSFWEWFDPNVPWQDTLAMYGDEYGKSLCHAWGAGPIYLIGRYLLGVRPTSAGYKTFEVKPELGRFDFVEAKVPIKDGIVSIKKNGRVLEVMTDRDGGVLIYNSNNIVLHKNKSVSIEA